MTIVDRLKNAWNTFANEDKSLTKAPEYLGPVASFKPDRSRMTYTNERSLVSSIYTRLSMDISDVELRHVRVDENEQFIENIDSGLNDCFNVEANLDQGARAFRQDIALTLFDQGVIAIVPVDTTINPINNNTYDIRTMRVGVITQWYPEHVRVQLYRQSTGQREEVTLPKTTVAIVENPLYMVMNEPNSTLQRLIRKLNLLDAVDEQSGSGKLDLIIQLPYVIKSEARRQQAENRRKDIEFQLKSSKYGIAYTDGTEKITQLNRPAENNLMGQIEYLTELLYSQLGLTKSVFDGTASEQEMMNYHNRTVAPIMDAISEALSRTFLTRTARSQKQRVAYFRDPFKLVPVTDLADLADKFTRNEILTSNEVRGIVGFKPVNTEAANELRNKNLPADDEEGVASDEA